MTLRHVVFILDAMEPLPVATFWAHALGYRIAEHAEPYVVLLANDHGPDLIIQRVAEPKVTKNRMHLDIRTDDLDAEVARLRQLGASMLSEHLIEEAGFRWYVMADPDGNEFCVNARA
jgi:predicted enzyme related to lactoylglutathione lyase